MKRNRFILSFLLCFYAAVCIQSASFKHLNVENGISSHRVFQIEKDTTGFVWFLTYMSIDRFDGSEIKHYKLKYGNTIEENFLSSVKMVRDAKGVIWVSIEDGRIYKYHKELDDFKLELDVRNLISINGLLLTSIFFDRDNRLWICSNLGLYVHNAKETKMHSILPLRDEAPTLVYHKSGNQYFVGTQNGVYTLQDKGNYQFEIISANSQTKQCGRIESLFYHNNKLYIGTDSKSIFIQNTATGNCNSLSAIVPTNPIRVIQATRNGQILIGSDGGGIYCIDAISDNLIHTFVADDDNMKSDLKGNTVYDILVDELDCIWVSTYTNGISILEPHSPVVQIKQHEYKTPNSLTNSCINSILEDSDGDIWYGSNNGVSCHHIQTDTWQHYFNNRENKAVILAICEDKKKRIWVGGFGVGAYCIDKKTGDIKSYQKDTQRSGKGLDTNYIFIIHADHENVWLGGVEGGLSQYDMAKDCFYYHNITAVGELKDLDENTLLCGTASGISVLNKQTHLFKAYQNFGQSTIVRAVRSIYVEDKNNIWFGTEGNGLVCFHPSSEQFDVYTTQQGLISNYIFSIKEDNQKRLWFTTEKDISFMDTKTKAVTNMTEYMGVGNLNYNPKAAFKCKNGEIIFGATEGAIQFQPFSKPDVQAYSKTIFTDFKLFYNSVKMGNDESPLKQAINETSHIELMHDQNSFSFAFSSINFKYPNQVIYTYMLEGFEQKWYSAPDNNNVNYTNINPGNYTFRLRALSKSTKEIIDERSIEIKILPPFWESGWAILIYCTLALIVVYFVIQYIQNKIEKRNSREKIQFFINVAHDIRTPVTLIKGPLSEIEESETLSESGQLSLKIAHRNTDRLFHMVSQLLDFQKADLSALRLIVSKNELRSYIEEKNSQFQVEAVHKQIDLRLGMDIESLIYVWFDREKMDRIWNNLLSNAIKYTPKGGIVRISVTQNDKKWFVSVFDSGIGIPQSEQKFLFKRFFRAKNAINSKETGSGIGLLLTKKLVKLHHGDITFTSKEGIGTEFKLSFHKGNTYFVRHQKLEEYITHEPPKVQLIEDIPLPDSTLPTSNERTVKILLVEDNDEMRLYLRSSLSREYDIVEATDGEDAMEKLQELNPDMIVSDIMMPRMNGDLLCKTLKASVETSHIPIILLTALSDKENIVEGLDNGADDYITKPFDISVLKARIRNLLRSRKKLHEVVSSCEAPVEEVTYNNPLDKEFMEKIMALIEEHLDDIEFSINECCIHIGMSRSSLYNKLKALTGQSPNDFIRLIRLKKAAELLLGKRYNVMEVSTMTGFPDSKYFSTVFKKQFGQSPSKYGKE